MTFSNFVPNGVSSMELVKGTVFNEETRRKAYNIKKVQALIIESRRRNRNRE